MIFGAEWLNHKEIGYWFIIPENVLLKKENIRLIDYGMKFMNNEKIISNYMSPELVKKLIKNKKTKAK